MEGLHCRKISLQWVHFLFTLGLLITPYTSDAVVSRCEGAFNGPLDIFKEPPEKFESSLRPLLLSESDLGKVFGPDRRDLVDAFQMLGQAFKKPNQHLRWYRGMRLTPGQLAHILNEGMEVHRAGLDEIHLTDDPGFAATYAIEPYRGGQKAGVIPDDGFLSIVLRLKLNPKLPLNIRQFEESRVGVSKVSIPPQKIDQVWAFDKILKKFILIGKY